MAGNNMDIQALRKKARRLFKEGSFERDYIDSALGAFSTKWENLVSDRIDT